LHLADVAQAVQRGDGRDRHRGSLLEGQVGRLGRQQVFGDAGEPGEAAGRGLGVDAIPRPEPGHGRADRLDPPGKVTPAHGDPWPPHPGRCPHDVGPAAGGEPVAVVDRGGMDTDEHVMGAGGGRGDVLQPQDVSASVGALDDRPHHALTAVGASRSGPR